MLTFALLVFAVGAIGGLVLASHVLRGKFAPWALSLIHALLGAIGLILLIVVLVHGAATHQVTISFILFLIAALGGFALASFHLRKRLPPKAAVIGHAGLAIIGFLVLLAAVI